MCYSKRHANHAIIQSSDALMTEGVMSITMKVARRQCQHASGEEAKKDNHNSGSNGNGAGRQHCSNRVHPMNEPPLYVGLMGT